MQLEWNMSSKSIGVGYSPSVFSPSENYDAIKVRSRHYIEATVFVILSTLFCWSFFAFVLVPLQYQNGYVNQANAPPGNWQSGRYTWEWWASWLLGLNLLLPYLFAAALCNNTMQEWAKLHYFLARLALALNFIAFVILSILWLFFCNFSYSPWNTSCNSIYYCCAYFADNPTWCSNFGLCVPDVTPGQLHRSEPFFWTWLFTIFFFLWALGHRSMNRDMRSYGLFSQVN